MVVKMSCKVTVIIPHWNGEDILRRCLLSLRKTRYKDFKILIVNNGSTDGSIPAVVKHFPEVRIVHSRTNLGFAEGCNLGIRSSTSPYVVLLNNDTEVTPDWLAPLVEVADKNPHVAAIQPKMLSIQNQKQFDYCGAAGGEMDIFGYPFAKGRIFDILETDYKQYDKSRYIFWATGATALLRRSALDRVGLLDECFFAHMEEIDLDWRFQLAGFRIQVIPGVVVYHQTGGTLGSAKLKKMMLNHRNSLIMILKNYTFSTLLWLFPLRLILEGITLIVFLLKGKPKRSIAVIGGLIGVLGLWKHILVEKKQINAYRRIPDSMLMHRMYRGSVALAYYLKKVKSAFELRIDS